MRRLFKIKCEVRPIKSQILCYYIIVQKLAYLIIINSFCLNYSQAFDDHVKWCEEKKRRLQDSPKKDHEALAKLNLRTTYKPKTPLATRKSSSNNQNNHESSNDDRKESFESTKSEPTPNLRMKRKVLICTMVFQDVEMKTYISYYIF